MTNSNLIVAGSRILASVIQDVAPLAVVKLANQSVTSSTTLVNDNDFALPMVANAVYIFRAYFNYEGATATNAGMKFGWTFPSGLTMAFGLARLEVDDATTDVSRSWSQSAVPTIGSNGAGDVRAATLSGTIIVSSTAGTLQLQWAQNASNAVATIMHAHSYLAAWRVS